MTTERENLTPEERAEAVADAEFEGNAAVADRLDVSDATLRKWRQRLPEDEGALAAYHARMRERVGDGSEQSTAIALDAVNAEIARRARGEDPRSQLSDVHLMGYQRSLSTAQIQRRGLLQASKSGGRELPPVIARLVPPSAEQRKAGK